MIILFVVDGMLSGQLRDKRLPNFISLFSRGAWSLNAYVAHPAYTEPSFAALFHGVESMYLKCYFDDLKTLGTYRDYPPNTVNLFQAMKPHSSVIINTWPGFHEEIVDKKYIDTIHSWSAPRALDQGVPELTARMIRERKHDFVFSYLEGPDHNFHYHGIGPESWAAMKFADATLGVILKAMDPARDILFVTSDHGRDITGRSKGREHNKFSRETCRIPLFVVGKGIKKKELTCDFISNTDVAPTILHLMKRPIPHSMRGHVLTCLF